MINLKEKIKLDFMTALKEKNIEKRAVLSTVIGELDRTSKTPTDKQTINVVSKLIANNVLTNNESENVYLEKYVPKKIHEDELDVIVKSIVETYDLIGMAGVKTIMEELNINYTGQFDSKVVVNIAKKYLI